MSDDEGEDDLSSDMATTEKYRSRSKSVATLTAAAAGALAAGLALNPALVAFPLTTRVLGMATIVFLLLSTGAFVVASVLHARSVKNGEKIGRLHHFLRPWEALFTSENEWPSVSEYRKSVEAVQRQIMRATDVGMWLAAAAIVCLVTALVSMSVLNEQRSVVSIAVTSDSRANELCAALPPRFDATVRTVEIDSPTSTLTFYVAGDICGLEPGTMTAAITVLRTDVLLIDPARR